MAADDVTDALVLASQAELEELPADALALCTEALKSRPEHPLALNLLGRLCERAGDAAHALTLQGYALYLDPDHSRAGRDLDALLSTGPRFAERSHAKLAEATRLAPEIAVHQRDPASLPSFDGLDAVETIVRESIELDRTCADAHAALANVLARRGQQAEATVEYGIAVRLRPNFAEAHLALAKLLEAQEHFDRADVHWHRAMACARVYPDVVYPTVALRVLALCVPRASTITPLHYLVDPQHTAVHAYYLASGAPPPASLPEYDLVFTAIEESEFSAPGIAMASAFITSQKRPSINDPARLAGIGRCALARTLERVEGCSVPSWVRRSRASLGDLQENASTIAGIPFPLLVRPIDTFRGIGMEKLDSASEVPEYVARHDEAYFHVSPFVEYRSPDGYYRKYRVVLIDGVPYPYHLAISQRWMVHYFSSDMAEHEWMREEERRFLADPVTAFPRWNTVFGEIASAIGLDYCALDCTVLGDGSVLVFECGSAMLVRSDPRIFDAFDALLKRRITSR